LCCDLHLDAGMRASRGASPCRREATAVPSLCTSARLALLPGVWSVRGSASRICNRSAVE
jgi:hypothetical protein